MLLPIIKILLETIGKFHRNSILVVKILLNTDKVQLLKTYQLKTRPRKICQLIWNLAQLVKRAGKGIRPLKMNRKILCKYIRTQIWILNKFHLFSKREIKHNPHQEVTIKMQVQNNLWVTRKVSIMLAHIKQKWSILNLKIVFKRSKHLMENPTMKLALNYQITLLIR